MTISSVKKKSFTLMELLIVVVILGILGGMVLLLINPARFNARARDAQRIRDIEVVSQALSQYYSDNNAYPVVAYATLSTTLQSYLNSTQFPNDPNGAPSYCYTGAVQGFSLCGCLEVMAEDLNGATECQVVASCTSTRSYCVRAPF